MSKLEAFFRLAHFFACRALVFIIICELFVLGGILWLNASH